jgi:hypothetical protein
MKIVRWYWGTELDHGTDMYGWTTHRLWGFAITRWFFGLQRWRRVGEPRRKLWR